MKTHKRLQNLWGFTFAALALGALALLGGCASQDEAPSSNGPAILAVNVAGISDAAQEGDTRSLPVLETVSQVQADGTVLDFTLTPAVKTGTRASTAMTAGNTYKYVVLDGLNKVVYDVNGVAGTQTGYITIPDVSQAYTIVAYSYNNTAAMPSPGNVGSVAGSVAGPVNTDLLYFKESLAGGTLAANSKTTRTVTFDHKYSQVNVVVDATSLATNVTSVGTVTLGPNYASTMTVAGGVLTKSGTTSPASISFPTLNAQKVTSNTALLFPNGETPLTASFSALTIGTAYGAKTVTFSRALAAGTSYTLTVNAHKAIPAGITLAQNQIYRVFSVNDADYLAAAGPIATPGVPATWATAVPTSVGATNPPITIQGSIPATGVTVQIPYTGGDGSTMPAYSSTITVPAAYTQDGISRTITFAWAAQATAVGSGSITATLTPSGLLNAKMLDFNSGIGSDRLGVVLGQFTYPYNNAGNTTTFQVRDIAAIPDATYRNLVYLPVKGEDSNIWLANNLGANYADQNSGAFNLFGQASSDADANARGYLYQWGRGPDGHEVSGSGTTYTLSTTDTPGHALFILNGTSPYNWRNPTNDNLWQGVSGINNPCPSGFRVPTKGEMDSYIAASGLTFTNMSSVKLKLCKNGFRNGSDGFVSYGNGAYYTSLPPYYLLLDSFLGTRTASTYRTNGMGVRCIKN